MVVLDAVSGAAAGLGFAGLVLLIGVPICCALLWPSARHDAWVRRLVGAGYLLTALTALASVALLALAGRGLLPVLASQPGVALAARCLLATALFWAIVEDERVSLAGRRAPVLALSPLLLLTRVAEGGALTGDWIAVKALTSLLHLLAVAIWLGGLVVLAVAFLPMSDPKHLGTVIPQFSPIAAIAVATLAATGVLHALAEAGSVRVLATSTYGAVLAIKLSLFAACSCSAIRAAGTPRTACTSPRRAAACRCSACASAPRSRWRRSSSASPRSYRTPAKRYPDDHPRGSGHRYRPRGCRRPIRAPVAGRAHPDTSRVGEYLASFRRGNPGRSSRCGPRRRLGPPSARRRAA
jgi:copper transport protein